MSLDNSVDVIIKEQKGSFDLTIDGVRLPGVRGYKVENRYDLATEVTVTFIANTVDYQLGPDFRQ